MSLSQALCAAVSGLQSTQTALSVVAGNVANANTPGYVRKTANQVTTGTGDASIGVRIAGVDRELDTYVQRQLQVETSGGAYADLRSQLYDRLQQVYGQPGSASALETIYNNFTTALQGLTTSPDSTAIRSSVIGAAQALTGQLNGMTQSIQGLRTDAELGLDDAVTQANLAMQAIAKINQQLGGMTINDATAATLEDTR